MSFTFNATLAWHVLEELKGIVNFVNDPRFLIDVAIILALVGIWPLLLSRSNTMRHLVMVIVEFSTLLVFLSLLFEYLKIHSEISRSEDFLAKTCQGNYDAHNAEACRQAALYVKQGHYMHLFHFFQNILAFFFHQTLGKWLTDVFLQVFFMITLIVVVYNVRLYYVHTKETDNQTKVEMTKLRIQDKQIVQFSQLYNKVRSSSHRLGTPSRRKEILPKEGKIHEITDEEVEEAEETDQTQ